MDCPFDVSRAIEDQLSIESDGA